MTGYDWVGSDTANGLVPRFHKGIREFPRYPVRTAIVRIPPRGRRFKSCQPDREEARNHADVAGSGPHSFGCNGPYANAYANGLKWRPAELVNEATAGRRSARGQPWAEGTRRNQRSTTRSIVDLPSARRAPYDATARRLQGASQ